MHEPLPARIRDQAQAAVSDWATPVAEAIAAGTLSVELGPWLAARLARRDAALVLTALLQREQDVLADAGLPSDRTDDGVDVDHMETLCRQCPAVVRLEPLPSGKFLGVDRDGTPHQHRATGAGLDTSDRRAIAALFGTPPAAPSIGFDRLTL